MYKKVKFEVVLNMGIEDEYKIIKTVLTQGYAAMDGIVEEHGCDNRRNLQFVVNKLDLEDLRHDAKILTKAGFNVKEVAPG